MDWNLADLFELVADTAPDRVALAHGVDGPTRTWRDFDRNANALALHLARGIHERAPQVSVTRLASGLPVGSDLEYADEVTLGRAMLGRRAV